MTTRILLVKPDVKYPVKKQGEHGDVGIPLGLMYLAGYVRDHNDTEVAIRDYRLEHAQGKPRDLEQDLAEFDVIGVSACTVESPDGLKILEQAKKMGKTTVMGGLFPTFNRESVLETGFMDYVVRGEGELGLSDLVRALQGKTPLEQTKGVSFVREETIIDNPDQPLIEDLDSLSPAYDLINVGDYQEFTSTAPIYSARGCPMTCKFCTLNEMWRFKHRARSYESILQELEMLKELGFDRVHFKDETVTVNRKYTKGLFREIERANLGLSFKAKSRINHVEEGLVRQMVRAGLDTIHTGVESVSENALQLMDKGYKPEDIARAFEIVLGNGSQINPVYMFSWEGETPSDLVANSRFIEQMGKRKGVISYISFVTPHPGTGLEDHPGFRVLTRDYSRYTHKQPVAVPVSLGENGLRLMIDAYHGVTQAIGMRYVNPRINEEYLKTLELRLKGGKIAA